MREGMPSRRMSSKFRNVRYGTYGGMARKSEGCTFQLVSVSFDQVTAPKFIETHSKVNMLWNGWLRVPHEEWMFFEDYFGMGQAGGQFLVMLLVMGNTLMSIRDRHFRTSRGHLVMIRGATDIPETWAVWSFAESCVLVCHPDWQNDLASPVVPSRLRFVNRGKVFELDHALILAMTEGSKGLSMEEATLFLDACWRSARPLA